MGFGRNEAILAGFMLLFGTANTVLTVWQNKIVSEGRPGLGVHKFEHPGFQTLTMFLGELLCLFFYYGTLYSQKLKGYEVVDPKNKPESMREIIFLFFVPTLCDMFSTTLMNIGLLNTSPSIYQMMRGAMVLFTALFSVIFLNRKLNLSHYLGLFLVISGIVTVGVATMMVKSDGGESYKNPTLGAMLVFCSQIIVATQFVVEDKFIGSRNVPALLAVGSEGFWGVTCLVLTLPLMQYIELSPNKPLEDTYDAFFQCLNSWQQSAANIGSILTIACFNYCGISVTKSMSATHRTTIDSCRTLFVWLFSLMIGWEKFLLLELFGFGLLVMGTFYYNEILPIPFETQLESILCTWCFQRSFEYSEIGDDSEDEYAEYARRASIDANNPTLSPGQHVRSGQDHRLRYYTTLQLPAAYELPEVVTATLSSFRRSMFSKA